MNTFLYWLGAIVWAGLLASGGALIWWFAVRSYLWSVRETWWIVAYACYKRKNGSNEAARRALETAIRCSAIHKANPADERIQPDVSRGKHLGWFLGGLIGLSLGTVIGWHFLSQWNPFA